MLSKCKYTSHARIVLSYKQEIIVEIQKLHLLCSLGKNIASNRDYTSSPPISNGAELWRKFCTLAGGCVFVNSAGCNNDATLLKMHTVSVYFVFERFSHPDVK
jgi:hypothetical protein